MSSSYTRNRDAWNKTFGDASGSRRGEAAAPVLLFFFRFEWSIINCFAIVDASRWSEPMCCIKLVLMALRVGMPFPSLSMCPGELQPKTRRFLISDFVFSQRCSHSSHFFVIEFRIYWGIRINAGIESSSGGRYPGSKCKSEWLRRCLPTMRLLCNRTSLGSAMYWQ